MAPGSDNGWLRSLEMPVNIKSKPTTMPHDHINKRSDYDGEGPDKVSIPTIH